MSDDHEHSEFRLPRQQAGRYGRIATRMDPDTRRLMLFAGGLTGLLVCLIGASSLIGHRIRHGSGCDRRHPADAGEAGQSRRHEDRWRGERRLFRRRRTTAMPNWSRRRKSPDPGGMHCPVGATADAARLDPGYSAVPDRSVAAGAARRDGNRAQPDQHSTGEGSGCCHGLGARCALAHWVGPRCRGVNRGGGAETRICRWPVGHGATGRAHDGAGGP